MAPLLAPAARLQAQPSGKSWWRFYEFLARRGMGRFVEEPTDDILLLARVLWEEAARRGIRMREFRFFGLPKNTFVAEFPDGRRIDFEGMPLPPGRRALWWIDDKRVMKKRFQALGFPVARGGYALTERGARRLFRELAAPVIVKPAQGSASRHTTLHVEDEEALVRAFRSARRLCPAVIVEEELRGNLYRPTLVDGRLIATLRRDPPRVKGDGARTVAELAAEANRHPARQGPYFSHLKLDQAALAELARQNLAPESIPEQGRVVPLHQKINWSVGGTTADVSDEVHPDNVELFEAVSAALEAPITGLDVIMEDISRSWKEQERAGIIECNSMPFFDNHHLPFDGKPRDVAGPIWDLVERSYN